MDKELQKLFTPDDAADGEKESVIRVSYDRAAVEVETPAGKLEYKLKPMVEIYGAGHGGATLDPQKEMFMPLFQGLEGGIVRYWREVDPALADGDVSGALDAMSMNPEAESGNLLVGFLQVELRLILSLNNYSRQEVRGAVRKIAKSVERHTRADGPRGYLNFIKQYV